LGEISVFIFFGVVATMGTYYVQTLEISWHAFAASVPMGALSCSLLAINNLRDREQDELAGKRTLAVRLGDRGSRIFFLILIASAYAFAMLSGSAWTLLTLLTLPLAFQLVRKVLNGASRTELIPLLGATGKLQLLFAIIFAASLAL
jgi:1,4-dihydroxy-2-naphthoate octaprenyltransferase